MAGAACLRMDNWSDVARRPIHARSLRRNLNRNTDNSFSTHDFIKVFRPRNFSYDINELNILITGTPTTASQSADSKVLLDFARKIIGDMQPVPSEIQQMVDDEFWNLF